MLTTMPVGMWVIRTARICGVHGLAARARAHEDVDFQIFLIDFDLIVIFIGFRI
jgi:hypothetical protein